jgi:hypothetical protein
MRYVNGRSRNSRIHFTASSTFSATNAGSINYRLQSLVFHKYVYLSMDLKALKKEARQKRISPQRLLEIANMDATLSRQIANRLDLPLEIFKELAKSRDMFTRAAIAKNENTPLDILELLARDPQWTVSKSILGSRKFGTRKLLPRSLIEIIVFHKRFTVRETAAEYPYCPTDLLEVLAKDEAREVVVHVAEHRNTSNKVLDQLALHSDAWVRVSSIDRNVFPMGEVRTIPLERLVRLSTDSEHTVIEAVVRNDDTPTWLVEQILSRNEWLFETQAEYHFNHGTVRTFSHWRMAKVLRIHSDLSLFWLEKIAQTKNSELAWSVIRHEKVTASILDDLTQRYITFISQNYDEPNTLDQKKIFDYTIEHAKKLLVGLLTHELLSLPSKKQILAAFEKTTLDFHIHEGMLEQMLKSPLPEVQAIAAARRITTEN